MGRYMILFHISFYKKLHDYETKYTFFDLTIAVGCWNILI